MIVEELAAKFGLEVDPSGFSRLNQALEGARRGWLGLAGVFTAAVVGVAAAVKKTADVGDTAAATAEKLGITSQAFQELSYAAELTDTPVDALATGLKFLQKNAVAAAEGSKEATAAFQQAGIKIKDAHGKIRPTDELLQEFAGKFETMPQGAEKTALAIKVFGRAGTELVPILNRGREGIAALRAEAQAYGVVMSDDMIAGANAFDDASKRASAALSGLRNRLAGPLLNKFAELITKIGQNTGHLVKPLLAVVSAVGLLIDGMNWLLGNQTRISAALFAVGTALTTWAIAALAAAGATTTLSIASVAAAITSAGAWLAATLPLVIMGALLLLLIDDLATFATGGKSAIGQWIKFFEKVDPEDNNFVKFLKRAAALIFDVTDPAKWKALADAQSELAFSFWRSMRDGALDFGKFLGDILARALADAVREIPIFGEQVLGGLNLLSGGSKLFDLGAKSINKKSASLGESLDKATGSQLGTLLSSMAEVPRAGAGVNAFGNDILSVIDNPARFSQSVQGGSGNAPGSINSRTIITAPITVTVPPGTDAQGVGKAVKAAFEDMKDGWLRDAYGAVKAGG